MDCSGNLFPQNSVLIKSVSPGICLFLLGYQIIWYVIAYSSVCISEVSVIMSPPFSDFCVSECFLGADVVIWWVKLLPEMMASHRDAGLCSTCPISDLMPEKKQ